MGRKKGKGKSQGQGGQGPSQDQPSQPETSTTPTSPQAESSATPQTQTKQQTGKKKQKQQQQQGAPTPQQREPPIPQQQGPPIPQQQGPPIPQQQGPPIIQQQQGPPIIQQQGPPTPQQRGPPTPRQRGPPTTQQRGPPTPQQQEPPIPQQRGPPTPQQRGPPTPQQWGPPTTQQQGPPIPQQGLSSPQQGPFIPQPQQWRPSQQYQIGGQGVLPPGFEQQFLAGYPQQQFSPRHPTQQQFPPHHQTQQQSPPGVPGPQVALPQPGVPPQYLPISQQTFVPPQGQLQPTYQGLPAHPQQPRGFPPQSLQSPPPQQFQQQQPAQQFPQQPPPAEKQSPQTPPTQQSSRQQKKSKKPEGPQQQKSKTPQQPPVSEPSGSSSSPPFGGQGDCLNQLVPVKPGTRGRKIQLEVNHLALNVGTLKEAVHYDVTIIPDTPKSLLRSVLMEFGRKYYPKNNPAFDGRKNLYSPKMLPFGEALSGKVTVQADNGDKEFQVEIKFARTVDLSPLHDMLRSKHSPQDALQCLDIVLRNAPSNRCITAGRCFFTPPRDQIVPLGDGMEMYYGFYQSAIRGWKPLLNVDVAHKAFPTAMEVLNLICELGSDFRYTMSKEELGKPLRDNLAKDLEKFLRQLKVKYEITGQSGSKRIYRVNGLGEPPSRAKFKLEDGKITTVEAYFQNVKRIKLRYPHLPTLWVGARDRDNKILLPLEFCSVVEGQAVNRKMNENQTTAMIKRSATSTDIRKQKIMRSLNEAKYNNDPCIREFGFSVNNQFERLEARVLSPPTLLYANNTTIRPSKGVWRADRNHFLVGATINKWTIASACRQSPRGIEQLAEQIGRMAPSTGMQITSRATPPFQNIGNRQQLPDFINYFKTKQDYDLIFVVVPNSGPIYSYVKKAAELNVGCLTQCIKERTLMKLNPQTVGNILLKVNSKMNGTNHAFNPNSRPPILSRPCMIMGADVTHPSPDAQDIPSVAAVTASHDPKAFQYNICWRLQPPKVEIIEDLCEITKEQLMYFYQKTGCKPERIVFFRDGVSEGQFREVQKAEITAIRKACKSLQTEGYEPKITFLVVQKRHHTRLFPTDPRDSEDKNMNVPAGTCVDTMITNPMMQDFYLVSHASIQGVAKPTKYCTLWDDNDMNNDDIEELTYHLCHMFTRCNRSVSYPAPTYYAHLAAARAKVYIEHDRLNMDQLTRHQQDYKIKECISKGKPMFFV